MSGVSTDNVSLTAAGTITDRNITAATLDASAATGDRSGYDGHDSDQCSRSRPVQLTCSDTAGGLAVTNVTNNGTITLNATGGTLAGQAVPVRHVVATTTQR